MARAAIRGLLFAFVFVIVTSPVAPLPSFSGNKELEKLIVHPLSGDVYVAAVNRLYQLTPDLLLKQQGFQTGPRQANGYCFPPAWRLSGLSCSESTTPPLSQTHFHNQLFLLNETGSVTSDTLLVCGNVYNGECSIFSAENISSVAINSTQIFQIVGGTVQNAVLVSTYSTLSTAAVVSTDLNGDAALYVATLREPSPHQLVSKPVMNVVSLRATELFKPLADQNLNKWANKDKTFRPRHSFKSGTFVYFTSYQQPKDSFPYNTVLSRICTEDLGFSASPVTIYAYMEANIRCQVGDTRFPYLTSQTVVKPGLDLQTALQLGDMEEILIASFAQTYDNSGDTVNGRSAICVFIMSQIEEQFKATQETCRTGGDSVTKQGFVREGNVKECKNITGAWDGQSCSPDLAMLLTVPSPILSQPIYNLTLGQVTALVVSIVGNATVAFVGTDGGRIIKLLLNDEMSVVELSNSSVAELTHSKQILEMSFSHDGRSLFVMSSSEVVKVPLETCSSFSSCSQCVTTIDPFCGFCTLENKCSVQSDCQMSTDPSRWIQTSSSRCVVSHGLQSGSKSMASITRAAQIFLRVSNVPAIGSFKCVFGNQGNTTATRTSQAVFACFTPLASSLQSGERLNVSVSLKSTETNSIFVPNITSILLFDCQVHKKCFACAGTGLPCGWCLYNSLCTDAFQNCRNGQSSHWVEDVGLCPKLSGNEYFWPSGVSADNFDFRVSGENLLMPLQQLGDAYECIVKVPGGNTFNAQATRTSGTGLTCLPSTSVFQYGSNEKELSVTLQVRWKADGRSDYQLENDPGLSLTLFKCSKSATDCSECLAVKEKQKMCGWCGDDLTCRIQQECRGNWNGGDGSKCPDPFISEFSPRKGPIEGGTKLIIKGSNLGVRFQDIARVTVKGVLCDLVEDEYAAGKTIVCTTGPGDKSSVNSEHVKIYFHKVNAESAEDFEYVTVTVNDYEPKKGPASGGTRITVFGSNLDSGSNLTVTVVGVNCAVTRRTSSELTCITEKKEQSSRRRRSLISGDLVVSIDNAKPTDNQQSSIPPYVYTPDPTVAAIAPATGLMAGGIPITVTGTYLSSVQKPKIVFLFDNRSSSFDCITPVSDMMMTCPQPHYPYIVDEGSVSLSVTFVMDDVPKSSVRLDNSFSIQPDPVFKTFDGEKVFSSDSDHIILDGSNLNAVERKFYTVLLGDAKLCNVTNLSPELLRCTPDNGDNNEVVPVRVTVGNFSTPVLGNLRYSAGSSGLNPVFVAVPIAVIAGVAIFAILGIVLVARQRSIKREAHVQTLLIQMDRLEITVATECKQGFAELQTDLDDLGSALSSDHLPLLPFKQYAMRVLFPRDEDHAVLHPLSQKLKSRPKLADEKIRKGTDLFLSLIRNKSFLVKFVQCMEHEHSFTMKDRTEVASLLMVICQDRMDYATDILKQLLTLLIRKSLGKSHPKLLLRRTESVAEKFLTNWLTFCLHQHIQDSVGKPLYTLFRAVKSQIEKGPVDAITGESRYALSEDKLLRHQVDYREMKFTVVDGANGTTQVRLLDLDTISQAKDKILDAVYKTAGVSQRPAVGSIDLCLVPHANIEQPALRFRDEDSTTVMEGQWKRVNTIKHYNVPESCLLQLSPRDASVANGRTTDHTQMLIASPSRAILQEEEGGIKVWHLTKQVDTIASGGDHKLVSEIYLTRMLSTKRIVQKFVDDLFDAVFPPVQEAPFPIKYLFNFLDNEAAAANITDPDVLHAWKTNSVPLRFWINVIKNPDFVFDIHKSTSVDSCLSVIAQTFMDGCSVADHKLSKDSPSSKLLYNKEVQQYKQRVQRYYGDIQSLPRIAEADMIRYMRNVSQTHGNEFDQTSGLYELYQFAFRYKDQLAEDLVVEPSLARDFQRLQEMMK